MDSVQLHQSAEDNRHGLPHGHQQGRPHRPFPPGVALLIGLIATSTASTFIRLAQADAPSLSIAAWRLTLASMIVAPIAVPRYAREWRYLSWREWALMFTSGAMLALHFYTWISSLALTSVAASVVLVCTNPLFVALFSYVLLAERLKLPTVIGLAIGVIGAVIIGVGDASEGTHRLAGDTLALMGAISLAGYMLIGRRLRASLSLIAYIFPVYATAAALLMIAAMITHQPLTGYSPQAWLWLILVAAVPQVIGHSSYNWALGHLPATYVSLTVLAEPIGSTLLAWITLHESPSGMTVLGAIMTLVGIGVGTSGGYQDTATPGDVVCISPPPKQDS